MGVVAAVESVVSRKPVPRASASVSQCALARTAVRMAVEVFAETVELNLSVQTVFV